MDPESIDALFVYGSLTAAELRMRLLGREVAASAARIEGYRRERGRYFYIVPDRTAVTSGVILRGLSARDFESLDRYEETPRLYTRKSVFAIDASGARLRCWIYLPTEAGRR